MKLPGVGLLSTAINGRPGDVQRTVLSQTSGLLNGVVSKYTNKLPFQIPGLQLPNLVSLFGGKTVGLKPPGSGTYADIIGRNDPLLNIDWRCEVYRGDQVMLEPEFVEEVGATYTLSLIHI